jgi:hypothetical protein
MRQAELCEPVGLRGWPSMIVASEGLFRGLTLLYRWACCQHLSMLTPLPET